jgi:hypothetical protein
MSIREQAMSTHDHGAHTGGEGFVGRIRRLLTHEKPAEDCAHPHVRHVEAAGGHASMPVCAECGRALDAHDATLRRTQHLGEAKVCVDCGGTHWTLGTRRSV